MSDDTFKKAQVKPNNYPTPGPIGNTIGVIVPKTALAPPGGNTNPPIQPETPEEQSWWNRITSDMRAAIQHPGDATVGALKGLANTPSNLGTLLLQGAAEQSALETEQTAAFQAAVGNTATAGEMMQAGQQGEAAASNLSVPNVVTPPNTPAQRGGDDILTAVMTLDAGAGLLKGGVKGLAEAGKVADEAKAADAAAHAAKDAKAAEGSGGGYVKPRGMTLSEAQAYAANRAKQLQSELPAGSQGRVTMGVGVLKDADGNQIIAISTSEPNGYLRPGVTLNPGEVVVPGTGHAETDILNWATQNGYTVQTIGAGRPICSSCASAISDANAIPATPLKGVK
jgi:hypothetical protein